MNRILAIGWFALASAIACALAGTAVSKDEPHPEAAKLADRLGDRDYRNREAAGKRLDELGAEALPALRTMAESGSLEASERARILVAEIEKRIDNAKAIAGTPVELKAEEQTLGDALDSLRDQTGFVIQLVGDRSPLAMKRIPKGGWTTFWDALDSLAAAAGLVVDTDDSKPGKALVIDESNTMRSRKIILRKRGADSPQPICVSGAFRIEAVPIPADDLATMPDDRVTVSLRITPEPSVRWSDAIDPLVARAIDGNFRSLPWDFAAMKPQPALESEGQFGGGAFGRGNFRGAAFGGGETSPALNMAPPTYARLRCDPAGPSATLKEFSGTFRGRMLGPTLTVSNLGERVREVASRRMTLRANSEPMPDEPAASLLTFTFGFDPGEGAQDGYTFTLADAEGKPMKLSPHKRPKVSSGVGSDTSGAYETVLVTHEYIIRNAGKPAALTVTGSRIRPVEIPFHFKDLPVATGGGATPPPMRGVLYVLDRGK